MIMTLADDLSGAAETGGIALHFGLDADVQIDQYMGSNSDLVVVDTNTRLSSGAAAYWSVSRVARQISGSSTDLVFKKIDSVLRGNVLAETVALLDNTRFDSALIIAANPILGRTVSRGRYWIEGRPLDRTDFANDPEFPAITSNVREILAMRDTTGVTGRWSVTVATSDDAFPLRGIVVGEASSWFDMVSWAGRLDASILPVGSATFLDAYLSQLGYERSLDYGTTGHTRNGKTLVVSGSTSEMSRLFCRQSEAQGVPLIRIPLELFDVRNSSKDAITNWAHETIISLRTHPIAVVAIDRPLRLEGNTPCLLTDYLSAAIELVLGEINVDQLYVEGGSTAAALVRRMGWNRLRVAAELAPGVVMTEVLDKSGLLLTMKPGSYPWPEELLE